MWRFLVAAACCSGLVLTGCDRPGAAPPGTLRVVATTSILADAVREIGGSHVRVDCLMGPGIDPHRYQPSAGDLGRIAGAKIVFYHGLHLEGKMTDVLARPSPGQVRVAVAETLAPSRLRAADGGDGPHDPHVWMDPTLWADCARAVAATLRDADPANAEAYQTACDQYVRKILDLHEENRAAFASLPPARRVLVTSHDAFAYFGAAYGLQVRGLQGVSTAAEPSVKDVSELADFLGKNRVPAVFAETSVPPKGLQAALDAVRTEFKHAVRLVGGENALYSDALGEPGTPGETYLGMIRHNVTTIANALR